MKKPIKIDYIKGVHQMDYAYQMSRYMSDLEKYADYMEEENRSLRKYMSSK